MPAFHRASVPDLLSDEWFVQNADNAFTKFQPDVGAQTNAVPPAQSLYLTESGDSSAITLNDLHQGQIGDCFLISSIGEIANIRPSFISNMIHAGSNGTETVMLYLAKNGSLPTYGTTAFKPVSIAISNVFPTYGVNNGATQDVVNGTKEI